MESAAQLIAGTSDAKKLPLFSEVAQSVLDYLNQNIRMGTWMITRRQDEDWIVLNVDRGSTEVQSQQVFNWSDSFCSRMVRGEGPSFSADSRQVPAYAEAPIREVVSDEIRAYVGLPLIGPGGQLFGTLCGISPEVHEGIEKHEPLVRLLVTMLATILSRELEVVDLERQAEKSREDASRDVLTGLLNRRGLDQSIEAEHKRCESYGGRCFAFSLDLNSLKRINDLKGHAAGDGLIKLCADVLRRSMRDSDMIARVGGDEFIAIAVDCDFATALSIEEKLRTDLYKTGINAALGVARQEKDLGIPGAIQNADTAMYRDKRRIKRRSA